MAHIGRPRSHEHTCSSAAVAVTHTRTLTRLLLLLLVLGSSTGPSASSAATAVERGRVDVHRPHLIDTRGIKRHGFTGGSRALNVLVPCAL